jgi:hypothetical protein
MNKYKILTTGLQNTVELSPELSLHIIKSLRTFVHCHSGRLDQKEDTPLQPSVVTEETHPRIDGISFYLSISCGYTSSQIPLFCLHLQTQYTQLQGFL